MTGRNHASAIDPSVAGRIFRFAGCDDRRHEIPTPAPTTLLMTAAVSAQRPMARTGGCSSVEAVNVGRIAGGQGQVKGRFHRGFLSVKGRSPF
jgi:hypothetical protein